MSNSAEGYNKIIDEWVYLTPKSPHIVNAYCVFKDKANLYLQMTEWCDNYMNVYEIINSFGASWGSGMIPLAIQKMCFLFVIQISHAMAFAHASGLTHNALDCTQVLGN